MTEQLPVLLTFFLLIPLLHWGVGRFKLHGSIKWLIIFLFGIMSWVGLRLMLGPGTVRVRLLALPGIYLVAVGLFSFMIGCGGKK